MREAKSATGPKMFRITSPLLMVKFGYCLKNRRLSASSVALRMRPCPRVLAMNSAMITSSSRQTKPPTHAQRLMLKGSAMMLTAEATRVERC